MPDTLLRSLVDELASPDPVVRDERAYAGLSALVRAGDLEPSDRVWLAAALLERLGHERMARTAVTWLGPIRRLFASGSPGPFPPEASNTMRTLHVALGEQPLHRGEPVTVAHTALVREGIATVLHEVTPWSWHPRPVTP